MLVLSRYRDEKIILTTPEGRRIVLTVVGVMWDRVRIGVEADRDITVDREEIDVRKRTRGD
jgi:carbon storage regulator CsrA